MTKQAQTLSERELQRLLEFVAKTKSPKRNRAIILLTHLAGMRQLQKIVLRLLQLLTQNAKRNFTWAAGQPEPE
jgi:integrase/recombinase XerD